MVNCQNVNTPTSIKHEGKEIYVNYVNKCPMFSCICLSLTLNLLFFVNI